jgi:hypothetical protein
LTYATVVSWQLINYIKLVFREWLLALSDKPGKANFFRILKMISENETAEMFPEYFPELLPELEKPVDRQCICKTLNCIVEYNKQYAYKDNTEVLKRCFAIASECMTIRNSHVVSELNSMYVFALSGLLEGLSPLHNNIAYNRQAHANQHMQR